jgi:5-methylcytosine-specific restriction protein B
LASLIEKRVDTLIDAINGYESSIKGYLETYKESKEPNSTLFGVEINAREFVTNMLNHIQSIDNSAKIAEIITIRTKSTKDGGWGNPGSLAGKMLSKMYGSDYIDYESKMRDLSGIKIEHITQACDEYDTNPSLCNNRKAKNYTLILKGKMYDHKCIVGRAYNISIGEDGLLESKYYGSICNQNYCASKVLTRLNIELYEDETLKSYLQKEQDKTNDELKELIASVQKIENKNPKEICQIVIESEYSDREKELANLYIEALKNTKPKKTTTKLEDTDMKEPLNQILFGPPGTGKTYHTINKAIKILAEKEEFEYDEENRDELKEIFNQFVESNQIEFVTFHQSYGYEEFVEGIKAIPAGESGNEDGEEMVYKVVDGVFKRLCDRAKINNKKDNIISEEEKFDLLWDHLYNMIIDTIDNQDKYILTDKVYIFSANEDALKYKGDNWGYHKNGLNIKYSNIKTLYLNKVKDRAEIKSSNVESLAKQHATYNLAILNQIYKLEESIKLDTKSKPKNYIIIIDEINRGNISKIFGELITLIEDSKRGGRGEMVEITLPYSGERFSVPENVYLLGTMNTADRSIAPIDTALRRRFVFEEMLAQSRLLGEVDGVDMGKMLEAINARIEYLIDKDHTIGHAYLIDVKSFGELKFVMKNKILPLLAEYFYEDWENIDAVLNSSGFLESISKSNPYLSSVREKISGKEIYKIKESKEWSVEMFVGIYKIDG